jgi:hypothetical protein
MSFGPMTTISDDHEDAQLAEAHTEHDWKTSTKDRT